MFDPNAKLKTRIWHTRVTELRKDNTVRRLINEKPNGRRLDGGRHNQQLVSSSQSLGVITAMNETLPKRTNQRGSGSAEKLNPLLLGENPVFAPEPCASTSCLPVGTSLSITQQGM